MTQRERDLQALDEALARMRKLTPHQLTQWLIERGLIDNKGKVLPQNEPRAAREDESKGRGQI